MTPDEAVLALAGDTAEVSEQEADERTQRARRLLEAAGVRY